MRFDDNQIDKLIQKLERDKNQIEARIFNLKETKRLRSQGVLGLDDDTTSPVLLVHALRGERPRT